MSANRERGDTMTGFPTMQYEQNEAREYFKRMTEIEKVKSAKAIRKRMRRVGFPLVKR